MRTSPELLARVLAQMDNDDENTRIVAFRKAYAMMKGCGLKFSDIYRIEDPEKAEEPRTDEDAGRSVKPRYAKEHEIPEVGAYLQKPRARIWRRSIDGKRIIRNQMPPNGIMGRIRVLKDEPLYRHTSEWRRLTLSFETADALYEPFVMERSDRDFLKLVRHKSEIGTGIRFS